MTLVYIDATFLHHETGNHPENADRIRDLPQYLEGAGLLQRCRTPSWQPVSRAVLSRVHYPRYIDEIWALSKSGGGEADPDTVVSPSSYDVALYAVGAVCDATTRVVKGEDKQALCLVRPPGHHALPDRAMGFCIFNNVAVAARMAVELFGLDRVLIIDWDIHHGNGTQAIFWEDPQVGFFSIHRWPFYPGTGRAEEVGEGPGKGTTCNVPVPFGISREDYFDRFRSALEDFTAKMRPQLIFISAGFDTHRLDPVGNLGLETEDFGRMTETVLGLADLYAEGRVISVLEGGYHPQALAESVATHLEKLIAWQDQKGLPSRK
ncbi:MAG: histone deacetylase [Thermoguttaceae bacterium]|nr:histone deacetylase [Thermoguttaceae bacterium]MDW8078610.1 histone deacetylase [Thermoguttaceae bacterium]